MTVHVSLEEDEKNQESARLMGFKFIDIDESEINELLKLKVWAITESLFPTQTEKEDKPPRTRGKDEPKEI